MARLVRYLALVTLLVVALACAGCSTDSAAPAGETGARPSGDVASNLAAGDGALDRGDLAAAERAYRAAATLDPRSIKAQFGLGNVYVRQNKLNEAETAYRAALAVDPNMVAARANLGVVYYQMGSLAKAASEFESALRLEPNDAQTLYLLGAVRLQEMNLPEAEKLLTKARDIKPDLPEVYYGLGVLYKFKGQTKEAIAAFEKFLAIGPGQDPAAMDYARTELKTLKGQ